MQEKATEEQIDAVINAMEEAGVNVHRTTGEFQTILAGVGPTAGLDLTKFEMLPGVLHVHRISAPYKLAGRAFRPEGTVVEFRNGAKIGGQKVAVIAGPCAIESRVQIFTIAQCVKAAGGGFLRGGAFKPRSSPYSFQGLGIPGLEFMREAADANGLLVVSEVMEIAQIEPMLPLVDCFQVGARNMQNFNLLRELGQVRKPILLKRGIAATVEELLLSSEYILSGGNYDVILCERGIRTYETATRNTMDISAIPVVKKLRTCRSWPILRMGRGGATWFLRWPRPPWPQAPTRCSLRSTPTPTRLSQTPRRRLYLDQFEKLVGELRVLGSGGGPDAVRLQQIYGVSR